VSKGDPGPSSGETASTDRDYLAGHVNIVCDIQARCPTRRLRKRLRLAADVSKSDY